MGEAIIVVLYGVVMSIMGFVVGRAVGKKVP